MGRARELGFGITKTVVPYREIYAQVAGLEDRPPQTALATRSKANWFAKPPLRSMLYFKEVFPEACEDNPALISDLVQPKNQTKWRNAR